LPPTSTLFPYTTLFRSRVEIRHRMGGLLQSAEYSRYFVVRAGWTPDQRFLVFSTVKTGGHQPWRSPTHFFDRKRNKFYLLDGIRDRKSTRLNSSHDQIS